MSLNAVKMLGISITTTPKKEILEEIIKYLDTIDKKPKNSLKIFTPNTEQFVLAQKNHDFARVLNQADIAIPDSIGVVWASRILTKNPINQTIPGVEFMEELTKLARDRHVPIALIGGTGKVAVETLECLQKKYPGLATSDHPRIIFVAMGAPKQEFYIEEEAARTKNIIYMAVGGSFDIISGHLPRAPVALRFLGLEWLWRLILEPWRWKRQLALVRFLSLVLKEWLRV